MILHSVLSRKHLSIALGITAFFFVAQQIPWLFFLKFTDDNYPFYIIFFILGIASVIFLRKRIGWQPKHLLREFLLLFFPTALLFTLGISFSTAFNFLVFLSIGLYALAAFIYWIYLVLEKEPSLSIQTEQTTVPKTWAALKKKHGSRRLLGVFLATIFFFSFGLFHLAEFAAVDEPLWLDGRITRFWKNLKEGDFEKTDVSDKPGITIALASGPGLFFVAPKDYRDAHFIFSAKNPELDARDFYLAFRLPLLIVITLFLPFFYFLLAPLIGGSAALFSYFFIALSPVLIGMSKIVNPDSLLWIFAPLSFLAYLVYLEKRTLRTLLLSGIFLGLALLTKYVANFLIVYFFGLLFLRYLFTSKNDVSFGEYFKKELSVFGIWLGTGLATLYLLLPALWLDPASLLTSTIFSQAFEKVAPLFIGLIVVILVDHYAFRSRLTGWLMDRLRSIATSVERILLLAFLLVLLFVISNGVLGMPWIDFMDVLASPKRSYLLSSVTSLFFTNFYPLFFGVPVLVLFGTLITVFTALWRKKAFTSPERFFILSLVVFILLYALASTVNQVVLINRYQIMLYPLMGILGGIGLNTLITRLSKRSPSFKMLHEKYAAGFLVTAGCLIIILSHTPFPLSFSSSLLPLSYTTDIKDMGSGGYEAAEYLNTLPDAKNLVVWTDKRGMCKFFVGICIDGFNFEAFPEKEIDYVVVSAGRESRTTHLMTNPYLLNDFGLVRFDSYYEKTDPVWEILINGRSGQFVRVFPFDPQTAQ